MRALVFALLIFATLGASASPARAADVAPTLIPGGGLGPVLADGSVVWTTQADDRVTVRSRPATGGPERVIGQRRVGPGDDGFALAGGTGTGVLWTYDNSDGEERTLYGPPSGPLVPVEVLQLPDTYSYRALAPTQAGILRQSSGESGPGRAVLTQPPDSHRVLTFPRGMQTYAAINTAGRFLAGRVGLDKVVVLDLASGDVQRVVAAPDKDDSITNLAVSPDGSVAAVTSSDEMTFADPTATTLTVLRKNVTVTEFAADGTRIAQATENEQRTGSRVEVFDAREPQRTLSRGPVIPDPQGLALEGDTVAYRSTGCGVVANAVGGDTGTLLPAGPCVRTQTSLGEIEARRRGRSRGVVTVPVHCLDGPSGRCRIRVTVTYQASSEDEPRRRVGTAALTLAAGQSRTLRLPTQGRLAREAAKRSYRLRTSVRVTDPDGKTWVQEHDPALTVIK